MISRISVHRVACSALPVILLSVTFLRSFPTASGEEADDAAPQDSQLQSAREADHNGELAQAAALYRQVLKTRRETLSEKDPDLRQAIVELEDVLRRHGERLLTEKKHKDAIALWQELVTLRTELWNADHWRVGHAERVLELCKRVSQFNPGQQKDFDRLLSLQQTAWAQLDAGQFAEAQTTCLQVRELLAQLLGEDWFSIAYWVAQSGFIHAELGDVEQAEEHLLRSLEIRSRTQGEHSPNTAANLGDLGWLREQQQDYTGAADYYSRRLAAYRGSYEDPHLDTANALHDVGRMADTNGNGEAAITAYNECIELYRQLNGNDHESTALALSNLGIACTNAEEHEQARAAHQQSFEIRTRVLGAEHPDTISSLHALGETLRALGKVSAALARHRECLKIRTELFGEQHEQTSASLHCIGLLLVEEEDYVQAEPILQQNLKIRTALLGRDHEATAASLHALASLRWNQGELSNAEELFAEALAVRQEVGGENHIDTSESLFCLAEVLHQQGRSAEALQHARMSWEIAMAVLGKDHPRVASRLALMAQVYLGVGQPMIALACSAESLKIRRSVLGEDHIDTATSLCNHGLYLYQQGDLAAAEPLLQRSLEIRKRLLGNTHPDTAQSYNNLGILHLSQGSFQRGREFIQNGLRIHQLTWGENHSTTASSLFNLGMIDASEQQYVRAEQRLQKALAIRERVLGPHHAETVGSLKGLADLCFQLHDYTKAALLYSRCLNAGRQILEESAVFQSEQQQLKMATQQTLILENFLSLAEKNRGLHEAAFLEVLAWKGATLLRQRRLRNAARDTETATVLAKLRENSVSLSDHVRKPVTQETMIDWNAELLQLTFAREQLETELNRRTETSQTSTRPVSLKEIRDAQPMDSALLTFVEYTRVDYEDRSNEWHASRDLAVFVLTSADDQPEMLNLGPVEPVAEAVDLWRRDFGTSQRSRQAAQNLRGLIWSPVAPHLNGNDRILISPDGPLEQFPFGALPAENPDRYLLEDYQFATLPIPRLLPELTRPAIEGGRPERLLIVGDVNYDGTSAVATATGAAWRQPAASINRGSGSAFNPLPGTAQEIATIRSVFHDHLVAEAAATRMLTGVEASEEQFCQAAMECTHLHLATHGFFHATDPNEVADRLLSDTSRSELVPMGQAQRDLFVDQLQPGLKSGLVFSGANQPPRLNADDGILTATDIAALTLDDVRLVVLSACESGLGKASGGEGMLGVQRAFQVAGAQATIASLWPVSDAATQLLMERFYRNLWEKKMSRLDALREAQLHLLNHPKRVLDHDSFRGDSRVRPVQATQASRRLSPQFWAAFTLSGAWE